MLQARLPRLWQEQKSKKAVNWSLAGHWQWMRMLRQWEELKDKMQTVGKERAGSIRNA